MKHLKKAVFCLLGVILLGVMACGPAAADELPPLFLGDWQFTTGEGSKGTCKNNDWVLDVKPREIVEYESGCRFTSIKVLGSASVRVKMACRGAGDPGKWRSTEKWQIHTEAGSTILIRDVAGETQEYRKCP